MTRTMVITVHLLLMLMLGVGGCMSAKPASQPRTASPATSRNDATASSSSKTTKTSPSTRAAEITHRQLQARLMAFADRYMNRISEAVDTVQAKHPTPQCRIAAQATKYYPSLTVLSLACEAETESALLDLMVVVTLERMVWEGDWSAELFGDAAPILREAQQELEADIWAVADSVLSPEQIQEMRALIEQWRRDHPERRYVSSTRFDDVAAQRDGGDDSKLKHGFLAPVGEAARAIEETRLWGERALFLATRMPIIVHWQSELFAHELAAKPEVQAFLSHSMEFTAAAQRFADVAQELPDKLAEQRAALMRDLESQQGDARKTLEDVRASLDAATQLVAQVEDVANLASPLMDSAGQLVRNADSTLTTADRLAARFEQWQASSPPSAEPSRPFDIREYTQAAERMAAALQQLNEAIASTDTMLASPARAGLVEHIDDVITRGVAQSGQEARISINQLFWRGASLIGMACAGVILSGWIRHRVVQVRRAREVADADPFLKP